jgi:hypothetical protein
MRGTVQAAFDGATVVFTTRSGHERALHARGLSEGGFNTVYTLRDTPYVLRVSTKALDREAQREYFREIAVQKKLARLGLSPRVVAVAHFVDACSFSSRPYARRVRLGVVMERYDATLEGVIASEEMYARVFGEHDGEAALVELMLRVSRVVSCVDTKAANIVVRLDPVEFAMIDVDPYFCGARRGRLPPRERDFAECLRAGKPASVVHAAVSLVILLLDAEHVSPGRFPRIADAILGAWRVVERALRADTMGAETSAMEQIRHYTGIASVRGVRRAIASTYAREAA